MGDGTAMEIEGDAPHSERAICGFWRRIFAFVIDMAIMGAIGIAAGLLFFDLLAGLGGWGRAVGFVIALIYFGVCNSSVRNGQTLGKQLLKIRVVDHRSQPVSLPKSLLRFSVFGVPYFANGAAFSPDVISNPWLCVPIGLVVFVGFGGTLYLYVFNRRTRQCLHDLVTGTYLIETAASPTLTFPQIWRGHYAALALISAAVIVVATLVVPRLAKSEPFSEMLAVQQGLQDSGLVHSSTVTVGKSIGVSSGSGKRESSYMSVHARVGKRPADYDQTIRSLAMVVMATYPKAAEKDSVVVNVSYGYDIGIASNWCSKSAQRAPKEWKALLDSADTGR